MISEEAIKKLVNKHQTTQLNIRREYIQHLFLYYFYRQKEAEEIYFKGGTALRIIYHSPRFSSDLDFSSIIEDIKKVEKAIISTLIEIEREGIKTEIIESKKTTGGYLSIIEFQLSPKDRVLIQIEISFRKGKIKEEVITVVSDFVPPYIIFSLSSEQLVKEKLKALLTRGKPRDFYDLYFILRANLLPVKEKRILVEIIKILIKKETNFERELKEFLPKSHWPTIKNFKSILVKEIRKSS